MRKHGQKIIDINKYRYRGYRILLQAYDLQRLEVRYEFVCVQSSRS